MEPIKDIFSSGHSWKPGKRAWTRAAIAGLIIVLVLAATAVVMVRRAGPILKGRVTETLSRRFKSRVELNKLDVSIVRGVEVSGNSLRIFPPDTLVAAGATLPLISVERFSFHSPLIGLFFQPMHVGTVHVEGLQINIPPREIRRQNSGNSGPRVGKLKIVVDNIVCDRSRLIIGTAKPDKDPKEFELKHIELHDVGPDAPWKYEALLTNAIPRGEIRSAGTFGPWQADDPGESSVTGHYTFDHADLNTIRGIGGILSSVGDFKGQLDRIVVDGTTEMRDFSLDTANRPVPLRTQFHAVVDGITGDTYLQPVRATLQDSSFTASGAVINVKGKGHAIDLDIDVPQGRIQDFLDLAVKTDPPVMTGSISTKAKLHIRPGKERVVEKLTLRGGFTLHRIHFTTPAVQDKVDMLSLRARGEPEKARPGAKDVVSQMKGAFSSSEGVIQFNNLVYVLPGARVNLEGVYSMDGQQFDFHGKVRTDASLPQMVDSRWKSLLLRAVSPFFKNKNGGAEIPVRISGTKSEPKFGLDVLRRGSKTDQSTGKRSEVGGEKEGAARFERNRK